VKVIDHAGNVLKPGRLLRWQPSPQSGSVDLYVKVRDVVAPTKTAPGRVEFVVTFAIAPQAKEEGAIQFKDFITVMDPEDELRAETVLDKAPLVMGAR
jgi:hypothetical protein